MTPKTNPIFKLMFLALTLATAAAAQATKTYLPVPAPDAEQPIEAGRANRYKIRLEAGEFVRFEADQNGCDIIFALYDANGDNFLDVNNAATTGTEFSEGAVAAAGEYELQVVSMSSKSGSYKLRTAARRPATQAEIDRSAGLVFTSRAFMKSTSSSTAAQLREGLADLETARAKFVAAGDRSNESRTYNQSGTAWLRLGDAARALESFDSALAIARAIGDKYEIALDLSNIASVHQRLGDWQRSYELFAESLEIRRETGNPRGEMVLLIKLGSLVSLAGEPERALGYFAQALEINRKGQFSPNYDADILEETAAALGRLGRFDDAGAKLDEALAIARRLGSQRREASMLNKLGRVRLQQGDRAGAAALLDEALKIASALDDKALRASILANSGRVRLEAGKPDEALAVLDEALAINNAIADESTRPEILLEAARAERARGRIDAAEARVTDAIAGLEKIRAGVQSADLRDSFTSNLRGCYGFYVDLLMERHRGDPSAGFARRALEASERARARGLVNLLGEASVRDGADAALLARRRELGGLLATRLDALTKVLAGKPNPAKASEMRMEVERVRVDLDRLEAKIRAGEPRSAALVGAETPDLDAMRQMLDDDSVLLEYMLGEQRSWVWIVTREGLDVAEIPSRSAIEASTRRLLDALTARNRKPRFETAEEYEERVAFADEDASAYAAELGRFVLGPAAGRLGGKRILVVPDGALQIVPFAALRLDGRYLVETNETVELPSVTALAALRHAFADREPARKTLAVFADPVFTIDDPRVAQAAAQNRERDARLVRVSNAIGRRGDEDPAAGFGRLPFTRREADYIASGIPASMQSRRLDFDANRESVLAPGLDQFRYVHFATHGVIDTRVPDLSGVVLSRFDEKGRERPGFLRAAEIFGLHLNAEMVVLSACRTGVGREIRGEGLGDLTRGFFYAGARRVTVSMWDVSDEATADLMGRMYREMLAGGRRTPAAALRQAQLAQLRGRRWKSPYFWAPFVLQGEPR